MTAFIVFRAALSQCVRRMHAHSAVTTARFNSIDIAALSWRDFERLIGETFRRRGFQVTGFGSRAPDGAADLALTKTGERFLVQCKHWRKREVGVLAVHELNTVLDAVGGQGGYVLTAGEFTPDAREYARGTRIELIGGRALRKWLHGGGGRERRWRAAGLAAAPALPGG